MCATCCSSTRCAREARVAIYHPLRRQLAALCPVDATAVFRMHSVVTLIYLLPLFVVLTFGLPRLARGRTRVRPPRGITP